MLVLEAIEHTGGHEPALRLLGVSDGLELEDDEDMARILDAQFEGPLRNTAEDLGIDQLAGVDISLAIVIVLAALLYALFLALFPEPRGVFGPDGPRWFRDSDEELEPIKARQPAGSPAR